MDFDPGRDALERLRAEYRRQADDERAEQVRKDLEYLEQRVRANMDPELYAALDILPYFDMQSEVGLLLKTLDRTDHETKGSWKITRNHDGLDSFWLHGPYGFKKSLWLSPLNNGRFFELLEQYEEHAKEIARRKEQLARHLTWNGVAAINDYVTVTFARSLSQEYDIIDSVSGFFKQRLDDLLVIDPLTTEPVLIHMSQVRMLMRTTPPPDLDFPNVLRLKSALE